MNTPTSYHNPCAEARAHITAAREAMGTVVYMRPTRFDVPVTANSIYPPAPFIEVDDHNDTYEPADFGIYRGCDQLPPMFSRGQYAAAFAGLLVAICGAVWLLPVVV